jgi:hypothetical protein
MTHRWVALKVLGAALLILLTLSGAIDVLRAASPIEDVTLFGQAEVEVAELIRQKTPPRAVILHAPIHNSVVALTGRQSVMGYPGHLWTHGIDYGQRENEVKAIYRGGPESAKPLAHLNVDYVVIGPTELSQMQVAENFFAGLYTLVIDHAGYRIYRVK